MLKLFEVISEKKKKDRSEKWTIKAQKRILNVFKWSFEMFSSDSSFWQKLIIMKY